jgi:hypothetical protein
LSFLHPYKFVSFGNCNTISNFSQQNKPPKPSGRGSEPTTTFCELYTQLHHTPTTSSSYHHLQVSQPSAQAYASPSSPSSHSSARASHPSVQLSSQLSSHSPSQASHPSARTSSQTSSQTSSPSPSSHSYAQHDTQSVHITQTLQVEFIMSSQTSLNSSFMDPFGILENLQASNYNYTSHYPPSTQCHAAHTSAQYPTCHSTVSCTEDECGALHIHASVNLGFNSYLSFLYNLCHVLPCSQPLRCGEAGLTLARKYLLWLCGCIPKCTRKG